MLGLFKSKMRKQCESALKELESLGFAKSFGIYGREKTLTYEKDNQHVIVLWEEETQNPHFEYHKGNQVFGIMDLEDEVRSRYPNIEKDDKSYLGWTGCMNRTEFLQLMLERIKKEHNNLS